jgi:2-polyprenyl-3-methyl-5-hydroxy-6-metoxy-1,4-benzoquinol methylase
VQRSRRGSGHLRDDVWVIDDVLADQVGYYRRRAGEYDVTAYGDVPVARARIARLVKEMQPTGKVLEIACGTGLWTEALAGLADTVTAIDAAPEVIDIARGRRRSGSRSPTCSLGRPQRGLMWSSSRRGFPMCR